MNMPWARCIREWSGTPAQRIACEAEGDALYWPIYNLDVKNPHAKAGLEHADPRDRIASMRGHEADVIRLLGEIEQLVNEVRA